VRSLSSELRPIAAELSPVPRVYVDANLPWGIVVFMRQSLRWDVLFVLEDAELRRAPDREHFRRARDLGRTLITLDHDFFNQHRFPPSENPGVVVCSAPDEAGLRRLLTALDHEILGVDPVGLPLRGRTLDWHLGMTSRDGDV
jgi:hypothetical protein